VTVPVTVNASATQDIVGGNDQASAQFPVYDLRMEVTRKPTHNWVSVGDQITLSAAVYGDPDAVTLTTKPENVHWGVGPGDSHTLSEIGNSIPLTLDEARWSITTKLKVMDPVSQTDVTLAETPTSVVGVRLHVETHDDKTSLEVGEEHGLTARIEQAPANAVVSYKWEHDKAEFLHGGQWVPDVLELTGLSETCDVTLRFTEAGDDLAVKVTAQPCDSDGNPLADSQGNAITLEARRRDGDQFIGDDPAFLVLGVGSMEIQVNGEWKPLSDTLVVLRGTVYTFRAIPVGLSSWPEGQPVWTWDGDQVGTGETVEIAFGDELEDKTLRVEYDSSSKSVTISAIVPQVYSMRFAGPDQYDIADRSNMWQASLNGQAPRNDPGCFKQNAPTGVIVNFYHDRDLTFPTRMQIRGDVHLLDEYITGDNYARTNINVQDWPSEATTITVSKAPTQAEVASDSTVDLTWKYQIEAQYGGTDEWVHTQEITGLHYYLIWGPYQCKTEDFIHSRIEYLVELAEGEGSEKGIADELGPNLTGNARFDINYSMYSNPDDPEHDPESPRYDPTAPKPVTPWEVLDDDAKGDCATLCHLMAWSLDLLGVPGAEVRIVYPRHASWAGLWQSAPPKVSHQEEHPTYGNMFLLIMMIPDENDYEACCYLPDKGGDGDKDQWWMGGLGKSANSDYAVLTHPQICGANTDHGPHQAWEVLAPGVAVPYPPGRPN